MHVHLFFVTKYRRKILGELHCAAFHQYAAEVCRDFGAELKESNGDVDHVHMLIEYPPTVQLSVLVNSLKAVTSRRLRNEFLDLRGAGIRKSSALVEVILCWLLRRCAAGSCEAIHSTSAWLITLRAFQARPNSPPALCRREYPLEVKMGSAVPSGTSPVQKTD